MARRNLVLAVDVGTTKVSAIVAQVRPDGELAVLGIAATPVVGMRRGLVFEPERVAAAIRDAVNRANSMAGADLNQAAVGVNGDHLGVQVGHAQVVLKHGTVREEDLKAVVQKATPAAADPERQVIQLVRRALAVDGFRGVVDPVGMVARQIEAEVLAVTGLNTAVRNLKRVLSMAGITPVLMVANPKAAADGVLGDDERQLGVVLLDVGGGTTGVVVYRGGELQHLGVVPIGGEAITSDIAVGLGMVATQAERLKLEYAQVGGPPEGGTLEVRTVNGQAVKVVPRGQLEEIVQARVDEWLQYVEAQLRRVDWPTGPAAGVVMTGGGAMLRGLAQFLEQRWGWPVRLGSPYGLAGLSDLSKSPGYAVVVGVAKAKAQEGLFVAEHEGLGERLKKLWVNLFS
ncbi:MAG: cell division protein FtsA [Firmicutes bacterium]|nr:cell division protein FtsA [Alicyclobacillaceae bacterium]MCL6497778.1 cell division protein FtsA [Bacillota bacterium]